MDLSPDLQAKVSEVFSGVSLSERQKATLDALMEFAVSTSDGEEVTREEIEGFKDLILNRLSLL